MLFALLNLKVGNEYATHLDWHDLIMTFVLSACANAGELKVIDVWVKPAK